MDEVIGPLEVHHVTCDTLKGEGGGIFAILHLARSDGSQMRVSLPLLDLFHVASHLKRQLCEIAGVDPDDADLYEDEPTGAVGV